MAEQTRQYGPIHGLRIVGLGANRVVVVVFRTPEAAEIAVQGFANVSFICSTLIHDIGTYLH